MGFSYKLAKIITIKRTKDFYLINEFHNLSWITEINELFQDILIYWDAPVYMFLLGKYFVLKI